MSQFPRFRFSPRSRQNTSQKGFIYRFRSTLALGLAALLFFAPLSINVNAYQPAPEIKVPEGKDGGVNPKGDRIDGFIIEVIDGKTFCRAATEEELPFIMTPADAPREKVKVRPFNNTDSYQIQAGTPAGDNSGMAGLTIILNLGTQLQSEQPSVKAEVVAAFERGAQFWTSRIKSPVTINIDVDYGPNLPGGGPFPSGVLGSTGSIRIPVDYQGARHNLIAAASNPTEAALYNSLPASFIPTDTGNGAVVDVNASVAKALGIPTGAGSIASIAFNKNAPDGFDFNPADGITGNRRDFTGVAAHEIGHALGFVSGAGRGITATPSTWDLFRFRPGTAGNITNGQRIMSKGGDQVFHTGQTYTIEFVGPTTELGLSTGGPSAGNGGDGWQSSHWKNDDITGIRIGVMDPTLGKNVVDEPEETDYAALETIGWDLTGGAVIPPPPPPPPAPGNDNFANAQNLSGCSGNVTGVNVGATKEGGEPIHHPDSPGSTKSVWYTWQAPSTGNVTIDTVGSGFDTILAVYTGNSLGGLSQIINNDDTEDPNTTEREVSSVVTFTATQGTVYRIAVNGFNNQGSNGDIGNIKLNWVQSNCSQTSPSLQLSQASYTVGEAGGNIPVVVTRSDATAAANVDYATSDTFPISQNCQATGTGIASSRCDYATSIGTLRFAAGEASKTIFIPIVDDNISDGNESFTLTLSNAVGGTIGATNSATITITDNANTAGNPIDTGAFFIRQHYIDLLGREPDPVGYAAWQDILNNCPSGSTQCDRIEVSSAFFRSDEFANRGYFIYRFYSAVGRIPLYEQFMPDFAKVSGFLSPEQLEANKVAFTNEFMARSEFQNLYGSLTDPTAYVNALTNTVGLPNHPGKPGWIAGLTNGSLSRAQVLRQVVESGEVYTKYYNEAFVIMQYFGYLRRSADGSYVHWIETMNQTGGDYRTMINGFLNSAEYRQRFGQ